MENTAQTDILQGYRDALARFEQASDALFAANLRSAKASPTPRNHPAFAFSSPDARLRIAESDVTSAEKALAGKQNGKVLGIFPASQRAIERAKSGVATAKQALVDAEERVREASDSPAVLGAAKKDFEDARSGLDENREAVVGLVRSLGTDLRGSEAAVSTMRDVVAALGDISDTLKERLSEVGRGWLSARDSYEAEGVDLDRRLSGTGWKWVPEDNRFQPLVRDYAWVDELLTEERGHLRRVREEATGLLQATAAPRLTLRRAADVDLSKPGHTVTEGKGPETPEL